jgi:hypothetical protein
VAMELDVFGGCHISYIHKLRKSDQDFRSFPG